MTVYSSTLVMAVSIVVVHMSHSLADVIHGAKSIMNDQDIKTKGFVEDDIGSSANFLTGAASRYEAIVVVDIVPFVFTLWQNFVEKCPTLQQV